jgi:uncharacterized protein YjbI with pentapeptide repeats
VTFTQDVDFSSATITEPASFDRARFLGAAAFSGAEFAGGFSFLECAFEQQVAFVAVTCTGEAELTGAQFGGPALFAGLTVSGDLVCSNAKFSDYAVAHRLAVDGQVSFQRAEFSGVASFYEARFSGNTVFDFARFEGAAVFNEARFARDVTMREVRFTAAPDLRPIVVDGVLDLFRANFEQPIAADLRARTILLALAVFEAGGEILVRGGGIRLDQARFDKPTLVAAHPQEEVPPRVISLGGTRCAGLTISGLDLTTCRLQGAHNLDELRVERGRFGSPPSSPRWTKRRTIAEEHHWRAIRWPAWALDRRYLPPDELAIAGIYRALRKGLEDQKDEPGAADFYYGEMEMRRHGAVSRAERWILWAYWLSSGYALRASRAFTTLVVTVLLFAFLFDQGGLRDPGAETKVVHASGNTLRLEQGKRPAPPSYGDSLTYAAGTATAVLGPPTRPLTRLGEWLRIVLRVIGPVLIGLTVLSIRGRVKR